MQYFLMIAPHILSGDVPTYEPCSSMDIRMFKSSNICFSILKWTGSLSMMTPSKSKITTWIIRECFDAKLMTHVLMMNILQSEVNRVGTEESSEELAVK